MKHFSLKFIDIMVGIVLGLGFQWWPNLNMPWQYIAFIFIYLDIVDYWIDYSTTLKKFPSKREVNVLLDVGIMFALFLYIYSSQLTIIYLLTSFIVFKGLDYFWLLNSRHEYQPVGTDKLFVDTWLRYNMLEIIVALVLIGLVATMHLSANVILAIFIAFRFATRILASLSYKKIHFTP